MPKQKYYSDIVRAEAPYAKQRYYANQNLALQNDSLAQNSEQFDKSLALSKKQMKESQKQADLANLVSAAGLATESYPYLEKGAKKVYNLFGNETTASEPVAQATQPVFGNQGVAGLVTPETGSAVSGEQALQQAVQPSYTYPGGVQDIYDTTNLYGADEAAMPPSGPGQVSLQSAGLGNSVSNFSGEAGSASLPSITGIETTAGEPVPTYGGAPSGTTSLPVGSYAGHAVSGFGGAAGSASLPSITGIETTAGSGTAAGAGTSLGTGASAGYGALLAVPGLLYNAYTTGEGIPLTPERYFSSMGPETNKNDLQNVVLTGLANKYGYTFDPQEELARQSANNYKFDANNVTPESLYDTWYNRSGKGYISKYKDSFGFGTPEEERAAGIKSGKKLLENQSASDIINSAMLQGGSF